MFSSSTVFGSRRKPLTVIIADDERDMRELIARCLSDAGCLVTTTANGNELVKWLHTQPFDVIITDVIMPDGDGLEVIIEAKRLQPGGRVLAISGGGSHLQAGDCLYIAKGLGAHAVLMKPFTRVQLLEAVTRMVAAAGSAHPHPPEIAET